MDYKRLSVFCLIIFIQLITVTSAVDVPINPCSNIFEYKMNNNLWYGVIKLVVPDIGTANLELKYSVGRDINGYEGDIRRPSESNQIVVQIKSGQPIYLNFIFPLQDSLPNILFIKLNGNEICTGQEIPNQFIAVTLRRNYKWSLETLSNVIIPYPNTQQNIFLPQYIPTATLPPPPPPAYDSDKNALSSGFEEIMNSINQNCGKNDPSQPIQLIYNGEPALYQPWLSALFRNNEFICGGNIITNYHIITAAHCVENDFEQLMIKMGAKDIKDLREPNSVIRFSKKIDIHPEYRKGLTGAHADIAIIVLLEQVSFSTLIRPICLWPYSNEENLIVGREGTVAGWGIDEKGDTTALPKKTDLKIISRHTCRQKEQLSLLVTDKTFCAKGVIAGTGPCKGDSGGALSMYLDNRWVMRGVVSSSIGKNSFTCDVNFPSIYADVAKFRDWIYMILKRDL